MKKAALTTSLLTTLLLTTSHTQAFSLDKSTQETSKLLNIPILHDLSVGESGVFSYGLDLCVSDNKLYALGSSQINISPSKYEKLMKVTRLPGNSVNVYFSEKGANYEKEDYISKIISLTNRVPCKFHNQDEIELFEINTIADSNSMSELITDFSKLHKSEINESTPKPLTENTAPEPKTNWTINESKSPIDDSPTVLLLLASNDTKDELMLRCKENSTDAFIHSNTYLGSELSRVTMRFDDKKAHKQTISLSTNNKAFFILKPISFIKELTKTQQLTVRYAPYNGSTQTKIFSVTGLNEHLPKLQQACNW